MHRHARHHRSATAADRDRDQSPAGDPLAARASSPTDLATLFRLADGGTRRRLAGELQTRHGNAGVAALLARGTRIHGLPAHVRAGYASELIDDVMSGLGTLFGSDDESEADTATPVPTASGTTIVVNDATFKVLGPFADMAANLTARTEAGSVTSQVSDIYLEPTTGPVRLANVTVTESRLMPNWVDRGEPSSPQVAEWNRFMAALGVHEQTHVDIDSKIFANVHAKCIGVSHDKANERIDATIAAADLANDEFDTKTDHGRNAGTTIDTNVGKGVTKVP